MASTSQECKLHGKNAPFRSFSKRSSSDSSSSGQSTKSCVCAPPTHAGSFKCRLHRVNSHGSSSRPASQPPVSDSSATRTVEAQ